MIRMTPMAQTRVAGIPRESGDDPQARQEITSGLSYSPRERG